jgi:hypothetical protein
MPACKEYTSKRYSAPRRVPPYIAADCRGDVMQGTTGGKMYKSVQNKTQWRWNNVENLKKKTQRKSKPASSSSRKSRKSRKSRTPGHSPSSMQELNSFFAKLEKGSPSPGRKSRKSRKTRRISNSNN